jgi:hypothetical protein
MPVVRSARCLEAILLAVLFAIAYTQSPLFYSNQNQYLLHGLAAGGHGHLANDWLAGTRDPTPVFSALVAAGYRHLGLWSIQAAYFLILVGYFLSVRWLVRSLPGLPDTLAFRLAFAALFIASHAAVLRVASVELTGVDYPWYLQCGVANQYILGPGLQPSAFGTLLVAALAAFANGRTLLAGVLAGLTCAFHFTYLLPTAILTTGMILSLVRPGGVGGTSAFKLLLAICAFAVPAAAYALFTFGSPNPHTFAESQRILAEVRLPHHAEIDRWFAIPDALQLAWVAIGLVLLRRSPLHVVLCIAAAIGLILTLLQYQTGGHTFALMFPWRISALLVPVATAVIVASLAALLPDARPVTIAAAVLIAGLTGSGAWIMAAGIGYGTDGSEEALLNYVRTHAAADDVYLLPVNIPDVGTGRGTASTTFTPPPRPRPGANLIPVDLQRFRLVTGAPIYVDFKSVPYLDREVIEWHQRMRRCEAWYSGDWTVLGRAQDLRDAKITHVVAPASKPIEVDWLKMLHADDAYILYAIR